MSDPTISTIFEPKAFESLPVIGAKITMAAANGAR
jgi:hypothetical protein